MAFDPIQECEEVEVMEIRMTSSAEAARVRDAYFAKKIIEVENDERRVCFERIASSILGKTVFLVVETENLRGEQLSVFVHSRENTIVEGAMPIMRFDHTLIANNTQLPYTASTEITKEVGNFDDLNNNQNTHAHYTNLGTDHADKIIIRMQLRPDNRNTFNNWATAIGEGTANLEIVVRKDGEECVYYGDADEQTEQGVFLDGETGFTVENKKFYEIYHGENENTYNFLSNSIFSRNGEQRTIRRRIGKILNNNSTQVTYFYYDSQGNEHELCQRDMVTVTNKSRSRSIPMLNQRGNLVRTIDFRENRRLGEQIDAVELDIYENGTLGVSATNTNNNKWYANQQEGTSELVSMEDINTPLPQIYTLNHIFEEFNYHEGNVNIRYGFMNTRRRHIRVDLYAGLLGALAQFRQEGHTHYIVSQGFSYEDGSCFPSAEHVNGEAGDLNYLSTNEDGRSTTLQNSDFDHDNQLILCNMLIDYGFQTSRSENFSNVENTSTEDDHVTNLPNTRHTVTPRHNNHLHIYNFRQIPDIYG